MTDLRTRSIEIILANQSEHGSYIACPNFPQYRYCWLRDGTYTAYAMDRVGKTDSSRRFHLWVDRTLRAFASRLESGNPPYLPTRFMLDGGWQDNGWPDFQLDGYGTWLWGVAEHARLSGRAEFLKELEPSLMMVARYLCRRWEAANYDCWEEFGNHRHLSTLGSIYGGLRAIEQYIDQPDELTVTATLIKKFVLEKGVDNCRFVKSIENRGIDGSLLWLSVPYDLVPPEDERMAMTVAEIERSLFHRGVHRYPEDTYYGGGEWILLTCWLGWYYCRVGRWNEARHILDWVESRAGANGELPEQVTEHVNDPAWISIWNERWGPVATPLLWSHAMYLVLLDELAAAPEAGSALEALVSQKAAR